MPFTVEDREEIRRIVDHSVSELRTGVARILVLLNGDKDQDIVGVRGRLKHVEESIEKVSQTIQLERVVTRLQDLETESKTTATSVRTITSTIEKYRAVIMTALALGLLNLLAQGIQLYLRLAFPGGTP